MQYTTIGSCSLCGGDVRLPLVWMGVIPPNAQCSRCGATEDKRGPVIPMKKQSLPPDQISRWIGPNHKP